MAPTTFEFETTVIRGRHERELTVKYVFAGSGHPQVSWTSLDLSPVEWAVIDDECADRADADWAEHLADQDVAVLWELVA